MNAITEAKTMRKVMALILCDSRTSQSLSPTRQEPRKEDSIYLLPVVKDEVRKYAARKSFQMTGEIVIELRDSMDVLSLAESAVARIQAVRPDELLVANPHLLNESGLSAIILPAVAQLGISVETVGT